MVELKFESADVSIPGVPVDFQSDHGGIEIQGRWQEKQ